MLLTLCKVICSIALEGTTSDRANNPRNWIRASASHDKNNLLHLGICQSCEGKLRYAQRAILSK